MDIQLFFSDMEIFLEKYTRFMTKNVYITDKVYNRFILQYQYLFDILDRDGFLYDSNPVYQKVINVKKNFREIISLHNQKYLKRMLVDYKDFFDDMYSKDILDSSKRSMILCEEDKMLCMVKKNSIPLVIGKLRYLIEKKNVDPSKVLVVGNCFEDISMLREYFDRFENDMISIIDVEKEKFSFLEEDEFLIDDVYKYDIIRNYITEILFSDRDEFSSFYEVFREYIYLNQDYLKFDSFSCYHEYLYQRKFKASGFSLKKYNEKVIKKRRNYLRTICNENVNTKREVDIANFFYLNSVDYVYDKNSSSFWIYPNEYNYHVYVKKSRDLVLVDEKRDLVLNDDKKCLEELICELIKRRCPLEKRDDDEVFFKLRDTSMDSYFSNAISRVFLPAIEYYQIHKNFNDIDISDDEKKYFLKMCHYYFKYLEGNNLVLDSVLLNRLESKLNKKKYSYVFVLGNIDMKFSGNIFQVVSDLEVSPLLKGNIKLFMDYQKMLLNNSVIPISNVYLDKCEYQRLTNKFISDHLLMINQNLSELNKNIYVSFYDDRDKFLIHNNRSMETERLVKSNSIDTVIVQNSSQINLLVLDGVFTKIGDNTLRNSDNVDVMVCSLLDMDHIVDRVILPFFVLIKEDDRFFNQDSTLRSKLFLLNVLSRCRKDLYIVCPNSSYDWIKDLLSGLKNVVLSPIILV